MKTTQKYIIKVLLTLLFFPIIISAQFPNYSKSYNYNQFLQGYTSGGGGVSVNINNNIFTLSFSAGFTETYLKQGIVASLDGYTTSLPNTEIPIPNGSFFDGKGYKFYLINNKICIYGNSPQRISSFSSSITISLTSPIPVSTKIVDYLNNYTGQNKTVSTEYLTSQGQSGNKKISIMYFDGLGRELESVAVGITPSGKDLIIPFEYDIYGRKAKEYLPIPTSQSGGLLVDINTAKNTSSSYYGEPAFAEKFYDNSPLNRVTLQGAPGNSWQIGSGHEVKFGYEVNTLTDNVKKYYVTTTLSGDIYNISFTNSTSNYAAGLLTKKIAKDEDWTSTDGNNRTTEEYTNKEGQTILVRKYIEGTKADTHYVYDIYGNLSYVIPPLASAKTTLIQSDLDELCYQYRYDKKNRLVEKKLPGKSWEYMVYDQQDRLILTQDANMGINKQWLFTKYDQFGRVIYTGIFTSTQAYSSTGRSAEQATVNSKGANNETISTATFTASGISVYYTNSTAYPTSITKLLSVNYYDNYPSDSPTRPTSIFSINTLPNASYSNISLKGLPTASYINNIENDAWTKTYTWYDGKARAIGSHSINYLGGYTKTETELDFAGVPQKTYTYHKRLSTDTEIIIKERFEYDSQNRLVKHWHNVNNAANDELLTFNEYNELGQLKNKKVGGTATTPLQTVDYRYNIRGWMTGINLDSSGNVQTNKLFSYKISYQEPLQITTTKPYLANQSLEVKPKYNGNISEVTWFSGTDSTEPIKKYGYVYDGLNRLTAGFYYKKSGTSYLFTEENNEIPEYDLNGNISKLKRFAYLVGTTPNKIDDLAYTYTGNRLTNLSDAGNSSGYENASTSPIQYDSNGNMTVMPGKKIQNVSYNFLNLPDSFNLGSRNTSNNLYRADGIKIRKHNTQLNIGINGSVIDNTIIDYLDGFQYKLTYTEESSSGGGTGEIPVLGDGDGISLAMEQEAYTLRMPPIDIDPLDPIDLIPIDPIDPTPPTPLTNSELQFFPTAEGFYDFKNNLYIYQYKDHLGNVRISYSKSQSGIGVDVQDQNDYYPFGMNHLKTGVAYFRTGSWNNYKYNGKELQETGMYDYGARMYMPDIGRWGVHDPASEYLPEYSPYTFTFNDPIGFVDNDGEFPGPSGALIGALADYIGQVAYNYFFDEHLNYNLRASMTNNINVYSIGFSAATGFATGGIDSLKNVITGGVGKQIFKNMINGGIDILVNTIGNTAADYLNTEDGKQYDFWKSLTGGLLSAGLEKVIPIKYVDRLEKKLFKKMNVNVTKIAKITDKIKNLKRNKTIYKWQAKLAEAEQNFAKYHDAWSGVKTVNDSYKKFGANSLTNELFLKDNSKTKKVGKLILGEITKDKPEQ